MERRTNYLTENDCYKAGRALEPVGIIVHSTGVDQKKISVYTRQWNKAGVQACVHGFLGLDDQGRLCYEQNLPYNFQCWGSGSGSKGSFNRSHIQFEICETLGDEDWCRQTYDAALEICAELCRQFGIDPENVVTHSEAHAMGYASNHGDVMHWWPKYGLSMDGFRTQLKARLDDGGYEAFKSNMERYLAEKAQAKADDYAARAARMGVAKGVFSDGDGDGSMDAPQSWMKRQELAAILQRLGLLEEEKN